IAVRALQSPTGLRGWFIPSWEGQTYCPPSCGGIGPPDTVCPVTDLLSAVHPVVMGVLNVTPDSFSDGGRYADHAAAVAHGVRMRAEGADIVDIGGESTRPGAERVD